MIAFIIKSSVSLIFLYVFYLILLRNIKTFDFNRFYLLFSLIFSIIIPFINFNLGFNQLSLIENIQVFSTLTNGHLIQGNFINGQNSVSAITIIGFLLYIIVSLILFIRLILNLYNITKKINNSEQVENVSPNIVLVIDKTLPYSFFNRIIVNKVEYESGKINTELLIHEQTHCEQYHSIDILIIELIKVLLWFNPIVWQFKKEIQLNHEYIADNVVILKHDTKTYQDTILNLVFRNNSTYLASNFNYSLTKKRLIMMTKKKSKTKVIRMIMVIPLFFFLGVVMSNAQDVTNLDSVQVRQDVPPPPPPIKDESSNSDDALPPPPPTKDKHMGQGAPPPPPPPVKDEKSKHDDAPPPPPSPPTEAK